MPYDLVLKYGRLLDPSQGIDRIADIAFSGGKVAAIGDDLDATGAEVRDVSGLIVTPGLIDLHTHVYWGGTSLGVDADAFARGSAVTTCVDTGSAGPGNFAGFRQHVIEPSAVRILAYLNVSFAGIFGFSHRIMVGEGSDMRLMAAGEAIEVANANRDVVIGIKVRIGRIASGNSGIAPLDAALEAAERLGLPLMLHIDEAPPTYEEVASRLRPGDVLTHAFRPMSNGPLTADGEIKPAVIAARERGVIFDIGHGKGSFVWPVGRGMLAQGFKPDTISSDVHQLCINGPVFDQVTTLSKFLALGMSLHDVIAASTTAPAAAIRRLDLGTLKVGSIGDASVLSLREGSFPLVDVAGEVVMAEQRLFAEDVVLAGQLWRAEARSGVRS